jgi:hypothetical protein
MYIDWTAMWHLFQNFSLYVGGMVIYCIFIFSFYERVSKRLIFTYEQEDYSKTKHPGWTKFWNNTVYVFKYLFLAPLFLFFWFAVIAVLLMLMQDNIAVETAMLIAMALLATIRISAYYTEDLSIDVAKIVPLAMLAFFLVDMSAIDLTSFGQKLISLQSLLSTLLMYFAFTVVLEFLLRIYDAIANRE